MLPQGARLRHNTWICKGGHTDPALHVFSGGNLMRMILRTLAPAAAVIALSGAAFAAQATPAAKPTAVKPAKAAKVTAMATSGTISKFDAASNTLTVTTAKGDVMFMVGST